jgi:hypothetical protein
MSSLATPHGRTNQSLGTKGERDSTCIPMDVARGGYHSNDVPVSWGDELMAKLGYRREFEGVFIPEDTSTLHIYVSYADPTRQTYDRPSFERALTLAQNLSGVCRGCTLQDYENAADKQETQDE